MPESNHPANTLPPRADIHPHAESETMSHMKPKALSPLAITAELAAATLFALLASSSTWTVVTRAHGAPAMLDVSTTSDAP